MWQRSQNSKNLLQLLLHINICNILTYLIHYYSNLITCSHGQLAAAAAAAGPLWSAVA